MNVHITCRVDTTDYLLHHLQVVASSTPRSWPLDDYRLSFLFPDLRPAVVRSHNSPFYLLFKAVDILPSDYQSVVSNAATCLQLPVSGVLSKPPVDPIRRSLSQLRLSTFYVLEPSTNLLRARTNSEMTVYPYIARRFLRLVRENKIIISLFLVRPFIPVHVAPLGAHPFTPDQSNAVDATPFLKALNLISSGPAGIFSSKIYRNRCIAGVNPPTQKHPLPHKKWTLFWKFPLIYACRNVWY